MATHLDRAALCDTQNQYVAELAEAASSLEWAERSHRQHAEMAADLGELDLHWDVTAHELLGGIRGDSLERWRELIVQAQVLGFARRPTRVWQIGVFDGSALELGEGPDQREVMLTHPPVVSYRVPEDWREREQWPDFPRSHWPSSLQHGARIELVSECSAGRYRLTVGQIATGSRRCGAGRRCGGGAVHHHRGWRTHGGVCSRRGRALLWRWASCGRGYDRRAALPTPDIGAKV